MTRPTTVAIAAVAVVALALGLRLVDGLVTRATDGPVAGLDLDVLVPSLVAVGLLCVAGLARRVAPSVVGFALGLASILGAIEAIAVVRAWLPATAPADRPSLVAIAGLAGTAATIVAWQFVASVFGAARRWATLGTVAVVGVVAVTFGLAVATASTTPVPEDPGAVTAFRLAARLMLAIGLGALALGSLRVIVPRLRQAWQRARGPASIGWLDALAEAFAPGLGRQRASEAERARLAADLHAHVVPELRQAVATAAATPAADPLVAERLRAALGDLEALMVERHSLVLEEFGLVAALEWLAERTQERAGAEVVLDVDGEVTDAAESRPPRAVERAAFRVALLATDNAVRHAGGARIAMRVQAWSGAVRVEVSDDGPGFDLGASRAQATGRRGLADMATEAATVGARLAIGAAAAGTHVTFEWPAD